VIARRRIATSAIFACWVILACLPARFCGVLAQNSPTPSPAFDARPIQRDASPSATDSPQAPITDIHANAFNPARVLLVLFGILALIFAMRWLMRRFFPNAVAHRSTRVMKVLSRTLVGPRQNLLLVQIGKRLVMVGDSGTQLNPLCHIDDPQEVEAIDNQLGEESRAEV
jgi:flagellar biosynthetic protein FliO